jgi:hypothetical protein
MVGVHVEITRYVDDSQPGWVECRLIDAHGREWLFIEKVPVITTADLNRQTCYPQAAVIACQIVSRIYTGDREIVTIDTAWPWHVEATTGETMFEVRPEQLAETA